MGTRKHTYVPQGQLAGMIPDMPPARTALYKHDARGNLEETWAASGEGTSELDRRARNLKPIRYRGYYWDLHMEMYYLNSR